MGSCTVRFLMAWMVAWLMWQGASAQMPTTVVIEGGTLIDGTGASPVTNSVIVIEGDRITAVGTRGQIKVPTGAQRIKAERAWIIPGLIDAHVHLRDWSGEAFLVLGVTSVIEQGGRLDWLLAQKEGSAKGKIRGPRIFTGGVRLMCAEKLSYDARVPSCDTEEFTPESLARQVQALAAAGVDLISAQQFVSPEVLRVLIAEAHKHGLPVASPTFYSREAVRAGIDGLDHSYPIILGVASDDQLNAIWEERDRVAAWQDINALNYLMSPKGPRWERFMVALRQNTVSLVPLIGTDMRGLHGRREEFDRGNARLLNLPELAYIPKDAIYPRLLGSFDDRVEAMAFGRFWTQDRESHEFWQLQQSYRNIQEFLREYVARGGRVLAGSDTNFGLELHHELELLVDAGLSPMQAVQAATLWPAQHLRKEDEVGTIRPNRLADLLILDANPLEDIRNTKRIRMVLKGGVSQELAFHRDHVNPIPFRWVRGPNLSQNPVPRIGGLSPAVVIEESGKLQLALHGTGFTPASVVHVESFRAETKFNSDTHLTAVIPAFLTDRVGTLKVAVENPPPGGGTSEAAYLLVKFR